MSILITGFEPFDDTLNASQVLVESLRTDLPAPLSRLQAQLHFMVLPTHTHTAWPLLRSELERLRPTYCLLTGQARGRESICLERVALNLKDFHCPDAAGNRPRGEVIVQAGPVAYWSTLPEQHRLIAAMRAAKVPATHSNHAGGHLCNQTLYESLHHTREQQLPTRVGFVHVPLLPVQIEAAPNTPHAQLETARSALAVIIRTLSAMK